LEVHSIVASDNWLVCDVTICVIWQLKKALFVCDSISWCHLVAESPG
jgi:hypothetical protein